MNILITGIHGFVGSNLVVALKEHHILYGLDIVAPDKEGVVKTFAWEDIESTSFPMQRLPQFDAIIHLGPKTFDLIESLSSVMPDKKNAPYWSVFF